MPKNSAFYAHRCDCTAMPSRAVTDGQCEKGRVFFKKKNRIPNFFWPFHVQKQQQKNASSGWAANHRHTIILFCISFVVEQTPLFQNIKGETAFKQYRTTKNHNSNRITDKYSAMDFTTLNYKSNFISIFLKLQNYKSIIFRIKWLRLSLIQCQPK